LARKGHLCGSKHDCPKDCQNKGYCIIESFVRNEEDEAEYQTMSGERIVYKITKFQKIDHIKCKIEIPINEFSHPDPDKHSCQSENHKCGFQCKQCEYYCTEKYGHIGLHNCIHGNIKNSFFKTNDNVLWNSLDDILKILKLGKKKKYIKYLILKDPPPKIEKIIN